VFKLPRVLDYDLYEMHDASPNNFAHAVLPKLRSPLVFDPNLTMDQHEELTANLAIPFIPRLSFQDTYHRV
jgi:hypothetical protein